ncbi:MAG: hypothetical protein IT338_09235, partial [Thermomicrobiales bacterium]|nr:hypothetical protein [Thermomicrobiales bacterium]
MRAGYPSRASARGFARTPRPVGLARLCQNAGSECGRTGRASVPPDARWRRVEVAESRSELTRDDRQRAAALFKAYDVRGIVPDELTPAIAYEIGRAIVATLHPDSVVVGRDMRVSSPALAA